MSSNVCLVVLLLTTAYSVLSAPFHVGSASPSQDNVGDMLPQENEYLMYLYKNIEVNNATVYGVCVQQVLANTVIRELA